jgi:hypothetical protein
LQPQQITVDFNAQTACGLVSLETRGAKESIKSPLSVEQEVILSDGEIIVDAIVVKQEERLFALPDWDTIRFHAD